MSLNYGKLNPTPTQTYSFGSFEKKKETKHSMVGFWRIFIVVAEIAAGIAAEAFTAGAATPALITGIGLTAATADTLLSAKEGSLSGVELGINFGSALIPGAFALKEARRIQRVSGTLADLGKEATAAYKGTKSAIALGETQKQLSSLEKKIAREEANRMRLTNKYGKEVMRNLDKNQMVDRAILDMSKNNVTWEYADAWRQSTNKITKYNRDILRIERQYSVTMEEIEARVKEIEKMFGEIADLPITKAFDKSQLMGNVEKLLTGTDAEKKKIYNLIEDTYFGKKLSKSASATYLKKQSGILTMSLAADELSAEGKELFNMFIRKLEYVSFKSTKAIDEEVELLMGALSSPDASIIRNLFDKQTLSQEMFYSYMSNQDVGLVRRIVKFWGSERGAAWVQRAQLVDPNDVGRAPVEAAYKALRKKLTAKIEKQEFRKAFKSTERSIASSKDMDEAFVKSGGKMVRASKKSVLKARTRGQSGIIYSRYIFGIKKLPGGTPYARMVLVKFNKFNTQGIGKNEGGKKDILVRMSDLDFDRLEFEGTDYWFTHGKKRGWFVSRGGKQATANLGTLSNELSLFLGFVPIPALRNVLSIISNWVENAADMARGSYFKEWFPKFERAFVRSAINRSLRLTSRVIIGGAVKKALVKGAISKLATKSIVKGTDEWSRVMQKAIRRGNFVGRELQRLTSTVISTFEGKDSAGYFKFTDGSTRTRSAAGNVAHKLFSTAIPTAVRGGLLRNGTRRGYTQARSLISAKRNLNQMMRVNSAVMPSGIPTIRQITRFK